MQNLKHRHHNKTMLLLIMLIMSCTTAMAQTFTDHVRQSTNGKASVTITQNADVEKLVNSRPALTEKQRIAEQQAEASKAAKNSKENAEKAAKEAKEREKAKDIISNNKPQHNGTSHSQAATSTDGANDEMNIPTVDMRKKVVRGGYKVTGYRVQAFAGRNSKADRLKAESVGNAIKMKYPDQPVYVHFYSPRWICRVGNYRTYEEAAKMLKNIKAMGYSAATIIKGQITVKGGQ